MANVENTTSWKQIQQGVRETERLIGHKEFNLAMVKARQTLEYMVRCMAEKACLVEGDLSDTIDQLYEGRWISRNTKDHYHNIRILGNKAVHEGDDTAYDANQAYQMLVQEVKAFADEYSSGRPASRPSGSGAPPSGPAAGTPPVRFRRQPQEKTQESVPGLLCAEVFGASSGSHPVDRCDPGAASGQEGQGEGDHRAGYRGGDHRASHPGACTGAH